MKRQRKLPKNSSRRIIYRRTLPVRSSNNRKENKFRSSKRTLLLPSIRSRTSSLVVIKRSQPQDLERISKETGALVETTATRKEASTNKVAEVVSKRAEVLSETTRQGIIISLLTKVESGAAERSFECIPRPEPFTIDE